MTETESVPEENDELSPVLMNSQHHKLMMLLIKREANEDFPLWTQLFIRILTLTSSEKSLSNTTTIPMTAKQFKDLLVAAVKTHHKMNDKRIDENVNHPLMKL